MPTPLASILIHGGIGLLWFVLFVRAFAFDGLFAWLIGIAYVGYDTALLGFVFWQTLSLARPIRPARQEDRAPTSLGVIVAAHNEADVLPVTLAALFGQSEPAAMIVVADDGSTDGTSALLEGTYGLRG